MRVVLGNRNAVDNNVKMTRGKRATEVDFPDDVDLMTALVQIVSPQGLWSRHATEGAKPAWVASDNDALAGLLSQQFGDIEVRPLEDPYEVHRPTAVTKAATQMMMIMLWGLLPVLAMLRVTPWLKTNYGNDFQARQMGGSATTAVAKYVALTANATAPAATDTTLTGEIVTAGLTRQLGTYAHTTSAASYTITTTFTAQAGDVPVTVNKRAHFEAISGGSAVFVSTLTNPATFSQAGDQMTLTDTVNL